MKIGARILQIGAGILKRGKEISNGGRDYKSRQARSQRPVNRFFSNSSYEAGCFFTLQLLKFDEKLNY